MRLAAATTVLTCVLAAQQPPHPAFAYHPGDVYLAVERTLQRETDPQRDFVIATSHATERRYTVLAVDAAGVADVLVEESSGPQQLHEYIERGRDQRASYRSKRFDAEATVKQRVLQSKFTATRFRCEPCRDEPAVFYLQEIPELLAHALTLPADGAGEWSVAPPLPRLRAAMQLRRQGDDIRGEVQLSIVDPRVRDGAEVACPAGEVQWQFDPSTGLPRHWRVALRYPRFPIDRPNEQVVTGELIRSAPLGAEELAQLRADLDAFVAVRDGFFAGRFAAALQAATEFLVARPASRLWPSVQAEVEAFRRQVPHFGEVPPELAVAHWFGGEATTLLQLRGKVVLLDFWATWCTPCVAGMEHLIHLHQQRRADGLAVLGLTRVDPKQSVEAVRGFGEQGYAASHDGLALSYPLVVLGDDAWYELFAIRSIPKLVVLDRDGKVYWEQTGSGGEARLDRVLESLLRP